MTELPTICLRYDGGRLIHWFEPAGMAPSRLRVGAAILCYYSVFSPRHPGRSVRLYLPEGSPFPEGYHRGVDAALDEILAGEGAPTAGPEP